MDMKKILQAVDGNSEKAQPVESADMKKFMSIIAEGKDTRTNRLSMAEQMTVQHYSTPQETVKKKPKSIIGKYVEAVEQDLNQQHEERLSESRSLASRVMEKMYPGSLSKHIAQSQRPSGSVKQTAKQSAARIVGEADEVDTVTVDVPLLIRLLEYAREDAKSDMDLHNATEKLIELSKQLDVLGMDQYDAIVGDQKALPAPEEDM